MLGRYFRGKHLINGTGRLIDHSLGGGNDLDALHERWRLPDHVHGDIENDDISGSADITNKADIVMDYGKPKPKTGEEISPDARVLRVTKNRMSGVLTGKDGISLVFDAKSKRIAEKTHDFLTQSGKFNFLPVELNERQAEAMDAIFEDGEIPPDEDEEQ